jgi:hypothetical protein
MKHRKAPSPSHLAAKVWLNLKEVGELFGYSVPRLKALCYRGVLGPHNGVYHPVPRGEWKVNRAEFEEKFIKAPPKAA